MTANQTRDKMRAVFLAALMVFSVFGGTVAFAGTAAANVESLSMAGNSEVVQSSDTIWVSGTASNTDDITFTITDGDGDSDTTTKSISTTTDFSVSIDLSSLSFTGGNGDGLSEGSVDIKAVQDSSDEPASTTFKVDDTAPTINSFDVTNPTGQDVKVTIDASEALDSKEVELSGDESATLTESDFTKNSDYVYEATYSASSDGEYTATLNTAADAASNDGASGESDSVIVATGSTLTIDSFSPSSGTVVTDDQTQISAEITADDGYRVNHNSILVILYDESGNEFERLQYGDNGLAWDGTTLTIDPSADGVSDLPQGDVTVQVYAEDTNGDGVKADNTFSVDSEPPEVSLTGPADGNTNQAGEILEFQVTDDSSLNPQKLNVRIVDENGNVLVDEGDTADGITLSGETLTIDPSGSDIAVDEWPEGELSVTITAADTHSNTDSTDFTVDVDLTKPGVENIKVSNEPISASEAGEQTVTVHFNESVESADANGVSVTYDGASVSNGEFVDEDTWKGTYDFSEVTADEDAEFVVSNVQDKAGNSLATNSNSDTVHVDTIEPDVTFSPDSSFETHDGSTVISGDVNLGNLFDTSNVDDADLTYEYTTDDPTSNDVSWTEISSDNVDSFDTADNFSDGEVTIRLSAVDEVENSDQDWGTVVVDNDDPSVEGTYEDADFGDGEAVYGEIDLTKAFNVSNADGQDVTYYYNTSNTDGYQSIGSTTLDTSTLDNGPLGLKAEVTDLAGNTAEGEANVTINNIKIDTFDVSADEGESTATINITTNAKLENVTIEISQNDGYFDEAETVTLDRQDFTAVKEDPENKTFEYTGQFDAPRDGEFKADFVSANATDGQRLVDSTESDTVKIDAEDPNVTDAEIIDADDSGTTVRVEFNEPVSANTLDADSFEIEGDRADVALDNSNAIVTATGNEGYVNVTFDSHFQTGDEPNLTVADDSYSEAFDAGTQNGTSSDDTTVVHTLELNLEEGHNVVSVPAASGTVDLSELDVLTENDTVWAYDDGEWLHYTPGDNQSTLESLEGGQGYIFVMDSAADVDMNVYNQPGSVSGDVASSTPQSEDVHEGWNLLGHWQEGSQSVENGLTTIGDGDYGAVYEQTENGELSFSVASDLDPGEGYWVFVSEDDGDVYGEHAWATS